jgi:hypothetical protein
VPSLHEIPRGQKNKNDKEVNPKRRLNPVAKDEEINGIAKNQARKPVPIGA